MSLDLIAQYSGIRKKDDELIPKIKFHIPGYWDETSISNIRGLTEKSHESIEEVVLFHLYSNGIRTGFLSFYLRFPEYPSNDSRFELDISTEEIDGKFHLKIEIEYPSRQGMFMQFPTFPYID